MASRNYIKRKSDELYTRAMEHGDSKATVIEHMSSLIAYCEAHTEYRGDDARLGQLSAITTSLMPKNLPNV